MLKIKLSFMLLCLFMLSSAICGHNFLLNGGFETESSPGLPDGWADGGWGIRGQWQDMPDLWRQCFRSSTENVYEGKHSLLIDSRPGLPSIAAYSCYIFPARYLKGIRYWTFSLYVYAESDGKVSLSILDANHRDLASKDFRVQAGQWTPISLSSEITVDTVIVRIKPLTTGKYYLDAAQFEENDVTPYKASVYDSSQLVPVIYGTSTAFTADAKLPLPEAGNIIPLHYANRTFYRNGRPFIPYIAGVGGKPSQNLMKKLKENGFNGICFYYMIPEQGELFEMARKCGLYTLPWMRSKQDMLAELIKARLGDPSLIAWKAIDEPINPFAPDVLEREKLIHSLDPARPIMVNYRTGEINKFMAKLPELPGQIISCDQYPLGNFQYPGSVMDCARLIAKMEKKLAPSGKGVWNWFQIAGNAFMNSREPTPAEYELMLYSSLIKGCRGFITFQNQSFSAQLWQTVGRIGYEFQALAPVIYAEETPLPGCSAPEILMLPRKYNQDHYLICVNTSSAPVTARFDLPDNAEVVFEGRTLSQPSDYFAPYQRHVYRWR